MWVMVRGDIRSASPPMSTPGKAFGSWDATATMDIWARLPLVLVTMSGRAMLYAPPPSELTHIPVRCRRRCHGFAGDNLLSLVRVEDGGKIGLLFY